MEHKKTQPLREGVQRQKVGACVEGAGALYHHRLCSFNTSGFAHVRKHHARGLQAGGVAGVDTRTIRNRVIYSQEEKMQTKNNKQAKKKKQTKNNKQAKKKKVAEPPTNLTRIMYEWYPKR